MSAMTDDSLPGQLTADYAQFYARPPPSNVDQEAAAATTPVPPLELNVSTEPQLHPLLPLSLPLPPHRFVGRSVAST